MAPPEIAMNQPVRMVAPDGAVSPAAGPAESPVPPPLSAKDALLAAVWDYKDRYGLAVLCMAGALAWLYFNYWKPSRPHQTPAGGQQPYLSCMVAMKVAVSSALSVSYVAHS